MTPETPRVAPTNRSDIDGDELNFVAKANEVFSKTRAEDAEIETRVDAINEFLDSVKQAAEAGKITSSSGEVYAWPVVLDRLHKLGGMLDGRIKSEAIADPYTLLPKKANLRDAVVALTSDLSTTTVLLHEISERARNAEKEPVYRKVQEDLGEEAVEDSGVKEPGMITEIPAHIMNPKQVTAEQSSRPEEAKAPFDSLPASVQNEIVEYRLAERVKRESEAAGNYSQAGKDGDKAYEARKALSQAALDWLGIGY